MSRLSIELSISLAATLSNVCQRFVTNWLIVAIRDAIDKRKFGSIPNSSTSHALISVIHHLLRKTDHESSGKVLTGFPLDFSRAFDLIHHNILVQKLSNMNVRHNLFNGIRNLVTISRLTLSSENFTEAVDLLTDRLAISKY